MKKSIPFIALALCGAMLFAAPKKEKIPITRIYDEVLGISDSVSEIYEFQNGSYLKVIPVETYAHITTQEALEGYKKIADQKEDMAAMAAYVFICNRVLDLPEKETDALSKHYLQIAAEKGFAPAIFSMAYDESDTEKACEIFKKAYDLGYTPSIFNYLALLDYLNKTYPQKALDMQEAFEIIKKADFSKSDTAQFQFACWLAMGTIIPKDKERATKIYKILLDKGYWETLTNYPFDVFTEDLSEQEREQLFIQKERIKSEQRQRTIKKMEQELPYLEKRAQNGDEYAMYRLAKFYKEYKPYNKLYKKYLTAAADAGHTEAIHEIMENYEAGKKGFERNKRKHFDYSLKLYKKGHMYNLVTLYSIVKLCVKSIWGLEQYIFETTKQTYPDYGDGITPPVYSDYPNFFSIRYPKDHYSQISEKEAFEILKEIADTNFDEITSPKPSEPEGYVTYKGEKETARLAVAFCYHEGLVTQKNLELAKEYGYKEPPQDWKIPSFEEYQIAQKKFLETEKQREQELLEKAQNGDGNAMYMLANNFYRFTDSKKAIEYFKKSIATGYGPACNWLANLYRAGYGENPDDYKKCVEYYKKGIALGNLDCMENLASLYLKGFVVPFDPDKAKILFSFVYRITGGESPRYEMRRFPQTKALLDESIKNYEEFPSYLVWPYDVFRNAFKKDAAPKHP